MNYELPRVQPRDLDSGLPDVPPGLPLRWPRTASEAFRGVDYASAGERPHIRRFDRVDAVCLAIGAVVFVLLLVGVMNAANFAKGP